MAMNINDIYKLWDRFDASDADELLVEAEGMTLHLRRNAAAPGEQTAPRAGKELGKASPEKTVTQSKDSDAIHTATNATRVESPLAGIFYRASAPDAEPFVKLGQQVRSGDVVGIVEAMKMMNEIVAPVNGTVTAIRAEDSAMVEYGQVLVEISEN